MEGLVLAVALLLALGFEFVNGFHDTASAVATVIYTRSLSPTLAVVWSGLWNLTGVLVSSGAVAFSLVSLLPAELVLGSRAVGLMMVFAVLTAALLWNLGTWYLGLPTSSSHTLIGAILGVGLASRLRVGGAWSEGINWSNAQQVGLSLLISPLIGFLGAGLLLLLLKRLLPQPDLYTAPVSAMESAAANAPTSSPPLWIRSLLILTCTGISFAHGSNDGQKGMGLIMLILVGLLPGLYALNLNLSAVDLAQIVSSTEQFNLSMPLSQPVASPPEPDPRSQSLTFSAVAPADLHAAIALTQQRILKQLSGKTTLTQLSAFERTELRRALYEMAESLTTLERLEMPPAAHQAISAYRQTLKPATQFIPVWVKLAVAMALGLGTMVGWQRIVVTVGEKIGKDPLTYGQGAASELVAMGAIFAADSAGLPVSTTQVLSAGVAGTMMANGSGIQMSTVKNILLAWVLTLPVCMLLSGMLLLVGLAAIEMWGS